MKRFAFVVLGVCALMARVEASPVKGQVVGPDGKPVAQAKILVQSYSDATQKLEATSDADGRFTLEMKPRAATDFDSEIPASYRDVIGSAMVVAPGWAIGGGQLKKEQDNLIKLEKPRTVSGVLKDDKGAPVGGAHLQVQYLFFASDSDERKFVDVPDDFEPLSARTSADGSWKIAGVPVNAAVNVELRDPQYLRSSVSFNAAGEEELMPGRNLLVAVRGGYITGRVVDEKGAPVAGVSVDASRRTDSKATGRMAQSWVQAVETDAQGAYKLVSVAPGNYNIVVLGGDLEPEPGGKKLDSRVAVAVENVRVETGKTAQAAALSLIAPVIIEGKVLDAATGAPTAGFVVRAYGPTSPRSGGGGASVASDKDGNFKIALAPGQNHLFALDKSTLYGGEDPEEAASVDLVLKPGETRALSLRAKVGPELTGVVVDEAGQPQPDAPISIEMPQGWGRNVESDGNGKFSMKGLKAGEYKIGDSRYSNRDEWTVLSPAKVTLPLKEPLRVVVRKLNLLPIVGRVVTTSGQPVEGATVRLKISMNPSAKYGGSYTMRKVVSDAQGRLALPKGVRPDYALSLESVQKPGFKLRAPVEVKKTDAAFEVGDIVVAELNRQLKGVIAVDGKPIEGAQIVALNAGPEARATSDAQGQFTLPFLPEGNVEVLAVKDRLAARASGTSGEASAVVEPIKLSLAAVPALPERDLEHARAIFKEMDAPRSQNDAVAITRKLAPLDPDAALEIAMRAKDADEVKASASVIRALARKDPARALSWGLPRLDKITDRALYLSVAGELGLAMVDSDKIGAQALLDKMLDKLDVNKLRPQEVYLLGPAAALAARLESGEAEGLVDFAIAKAAQFPQDVDLGRLLPDLARGGTALVERALAAIPADKKLSAYSNAIRGVAPYEPRIARKMLDEMNALIEALPEKPNDNRGRAQGRKAWESSFATATKYVIRALGPIEPNAVGDLARRVHDSWNKPATLALAANFGTNAQRLALAREAIAASSSYSGVATRARVAAQVATFDTKAASEMFEVARKQMNASARFDGERNELADFAFYLAPTDPVGARLLLEEEWSILQEKQKSKPANAKGYDSSGWRMGRIASAMTALDFERALEMVRALPSGDQSAKGTQAEAWKKIGVYALSNEAERRAISLSYESGFDMDE